MVTSASHEKKKTFCKISACKISSWLHELLLHQNHIYWHSPTTSLGQFLRVICTVPWALVVIFPQIKLMTLTLCIFFKLTTPSRVFLISLIVLFIAVCLCFISSRSLLNELKISCIFFILFWIFWKFFSMLLFSLSVESDSLPSNGLQHERLPCPSVSPRVAQTHVRWVSDAIQPSHPLSSPSLPAFNLSQHQGLFQWVSFSHQMAKVLELQLQH